MEKIKGERRKWRERCSQTSRYRWVRLSVLLIMGIAVLCGALQLRRHSSSYLHQDLPDQCGHRQVLSDQELYTLHIRKHANLKLKLLSERDGAPVLQSRRTPRLREITIVTQTSMDRLPHLEELATSWGGTICVAVHVKTRAEIIPVAEKIKSLHDRIEEQHHCRLNLQMVIEEGFESETDALTASYPVNALRNVALRMATTDLVFLLDIDFVPSPRLHEKLTASEISYAELVNRTSNERQVLVIPAFQAKPVTLGDHCHLASVDEPIPQSIPQSMPELRERWRNGFVSSFRPCHLISHDATSYSHFLHLLTTEPYHVQYSELYEPYFIAARTLVPKFDERFRGYGKNKIAHAYDCAVQGFSFVILPEVYIWEIPHQRSAFFHQFMKEKIDPCQSSIMNVVYEVFKEQRQKRLLDNQVRAQISFPVEDLVELAQ